MLPLDIWYDIDGVQTEVVDMVDGDRYVSDEGTVIVVRRDVDEVRADIISNPEQTTQATEQEPTSVPDYISDNIGFDWSFWLWIILGAIAVAVILYNTFFTVKNQTVAIIERFGKFTRIAKPGLNAKIPFVDTIADDLSLRVLEITEKVDTKTKDDVTVSLALSIQYRVNATDDNKIYDAAYRLSEPTEQLTSYVYDAVRSEVPKLTLDEAFANKDTIANSVNTELESGMSDYGWVIVKTLVTDINPAKSVREAMNEINAAQRLAVAAKSRADAKRIEIIGEAEGKAQAKKLSGEGIANQRKAIADGLAKQFKTLREAGSQLLGPEGPSLLLLDLAGCQG